MFLQFIMSEIKHISTILNVRITEIRHLTSYKNIVSVSLGGGGGDL